MMMKRYILPALMMVATPAMAQMDHGAMVKDAILDPVKTTIETIDKEIMPAPKSSDHVIINNSGDDIGMVKIRQATNGVLMNILVRDLPMGYHGMHFHAVGDCSDLEGFKTSGGHIMPEGKPHGFLHPDGPHAGNLPNLIVGKDGTAEVELYSNLVTYDDGAAALFDGDGSALIIHTNIDDHITQPIGNAGGRIACGVIGGEKAETQPVIEPALEAVEEIEENLELEMQEEK